MWSRRASTAQAKGAVWPYPKASNAVTPTAGMLRPSANPRAADTDMRMPVKFPGPIPTPITSMSAKVMPASSSTSEQMTSRRSACPLAISSTRHARTLSPRVTATAHRADAVSKARTMGALVTVLCFQVFLKRFGASGVRLRPDALRSLRGYNGAAGFRSPSSTSEWMKDNRRRRPAYADRPHRAQTRGT